jgi:hypothetical protein
VQQSPGGLFPPTRDNCVRNGNSYQWSSSRLLSTDERCSPVQSSWSSESGSGPSESGCCLLDSRCGSLESGSGPSESGSGPSGSRYGLSESASGPSESASGPSESGPWSPDCGCGPSESRCTPSKSGCNPSKSSCIPSNSGCDPSRSASGPSSAGRSALQSDRHAQLVRSHALPGEAELLDGDVDFIDVAPGSRVVDRLFWALQEDGRSLVLASGFGTQMRSIDQRRTWKLEFFEPSHYDQLLFPLNRSLPSTHRCSEKQNGSPKAEELGLYCSNAIATFPLHLSGFMVLTCSFTCYCFFALTTFHTLDVRLVKL